MHKAQRLVGISSIMLSLHLLHRTVQAGLASFVRPVRLYDWGYDTGRALALLVLLAWFAAGVLLLRRRPAPPSQ